MRRFAEMNSVARLAIVAAAAGVIVAVVGMLWPSPSALASAQPSSPTAASVGIARSLTTQGKR